MLNPFLIPRFKAAVVTTDLPMAVDRPIDFGMQDFCDKCCKCARECPSGAISHGDKILHNGYEKWPNDVEKCTASPTLRGNGGWISRKRTAFSGFRRNKKMAKAFTKGRMDIDNESRT